MFKTVLRVQLLILLALAACTPVENPQQSGSEENMGCPYKLPWPDYLGKIQVSRGQDEGSHLDIQKYAVDFDFAGPPRLEPILATQSGIVSQVHDGETACGGDEMINNANFVIVDHQDGTYSAYVHLQPGIFVEEGQEIQQGVMLGYAGNTGYTDCETSPGRGYHLHYQLQVVGDRIGQSIPACFQEVPGGTPISKEWYVSQNQMVQVLGAQVEGYTENIGPTQEVTEVDPRDAILGEWEGEVSGDSENSPTYTTTREAQIREGCYIEGLALSNLCLLLSWDFPEPEYFSLLYQEQSTFCFGQEVEMPLGPTVIYKFCFTPKGGSLDYEAEGPLGAERGILQKKH